MYTEISLLESYLSPKGSAKYNLTILTEAEDKKIFSRKLAASLFDAMKKKTLSVNYQGIEKTKGDITKYPKYSDIEDSIKILDKMYQNDPSNSPKEVKVLVNALANIKKNKFGFTKAFEDKNQPAAILYVNLVAAIISGASIIIASTVDYIKDPVNTYKAVFAKDSEKLYNHAYFKSLDRFNTMCKNGQLKRVFDGGKKLNESVNILNENGDIEILDEAIAAATIGMIFLAIVAVITCLNTVPYHIYCIRHKISEDLLNLAYFVEQHAYSLDTSNERMKKAQENQLKLVEKLKSLGRFIGLDDEKAEKKAKEEKKKDEDEANKNSSNSDDDNYSDDDDDVLL